MNKPGTLIPLTSPEALFAQASEITSPVPAPLYLFEFVPGTLAHFYPTTPDGTLRDREDYFHERTITYATGVAVTVRAVASPRHGLPMQHDTDIMLGLLRLADQGGVTDDGTVIDPAYRAILRAAGRHTARSTEDIAAIKRALARWTVTVETEAMVDFRQLESALQPASAASLPVPRTPDRSMRTSAYPVLEYSYEAESRHTGTVDTIDHLHINPVWLSQAHAGIASWIDVDVHNNLRSPWAKRIYQHLASRAALGWRPDELLTLSLDEFLQALAVRKSSRRPIEDAQSIKKALHLLQSRGVVQHYMVRQLRKGSYSVSLDGGEYLIGASRLRGVTSRESNISRLLVTHLKGYGMSEQDARTLATQHPVSTSESLRYLQYHQTTPHLQKPIAHPAQWLRRAATDRYTFDDPSYKDWIATQPRLKVKDTLKNIIPPVSKQDDALGIPLSLPATPWGDLLSTLVQSGGISEQSARMFFTSSDASAPSDSGEVRVTLPDPFAIQWVKGHYTTVLEEGLSRMHGRVIHIEFSSII